MADQCEISRDGDYLVITTTNGKVKTITRFDFEAGEKLAVEIEYVLNQIEADRPMPTPQISKIIQS